MAIFAEVVKLGSFREAAKSLGLSPSVISYHISQLEEKTGTALLYRSTRKLTLSSEGEAFYQQVLQMLAAANQGMQLLSTNQDEPSGKIKLSLPTALSDSELTKKIAEFALKYQNISLDIDFSDTQNDIIDERVDLTIRAGNLKNSDFKCKKIGEIERVLVCSPAFYRTQVQAKNLDDLSAWRWLKLAQLPNKRTFTRAEQSKTIEFSSQFTVNSVEAILQFCINSVGLAVLSKTKANQSIKDGLLVEVFPEWQVEPLPLYAVWSKNISANSNIKLLLSYLS